MIGRFHEVSVHAPDPVASLGFYERLGFAKIKEEKTDIGNGFVMDDYIMELKIS